MSRVRRFTLPTIAGAGALAALAFAAPASASAHRTATPRHAAASAKVRTQYLAPFHAARKGGKPGGGGGNLYYHGGTVDGTSTVGVETAPKVYLVFWGPSWSNDPSGEASLLTSFLGGVGGSSWNATVTQYCQGVSSGSVSCTGGTPVTNSTGVLAGSWYDPSALPKRISQSALASEAVNAANHFNNTTLASNLTTQYVIATPTGHDPSGFGTQYCAYHSTASSSFGDVAYTNLPYITDAGASCGANFNGLGPDAGITIVEGHEFAETETDQFPSGGWLDQSGSEIGDKCAWIATGSQGASQKVTLSTGTFPVQSLWSDAFNGGAGGCVVTFP